jgi:hypothetical protein
MAISKKIRNLEICPNHPKSWQFQNMFPQKVAIFLGIFQKVPFTMLFGFLFYKNMVNFH